MIVSHLDIDIKSIDMFQVFLRSTSLFKIADLIKSPVWLIVVAIVLSTGVLDFLPGSIPVLVSFPLFQCFTFSSETNVSKSLLLVVGLCDGKVVIHLKYPSL